MAYTNAANSNTLEKPFTTFNKQLTFTCLKTPCTNYKTNLIKNKFIRIFKESPAFLRKGTQIQSVEWIELPPGGRAQGMGMDGDLTIWSTADEPQFERIFIHELSHIYEEQNFYISFDFLTIRQNTKKMDQEFKQLWQHLRDLNKKDASFTGNTVTTDEWSRSKLAELNLPRRSPDDFNVLKSGEYWAISIEVFYMALKNGDSISSLNKYFSKREIQYLNELFNSKF